MILKLSLALGLLYSYHQYYLIQSFRQTPDIQDNYAGYLSGIMNLSSLFSVLLYKIPYKYSIILSSILSLISLLFPSHTLQRIVLGLGYPHLLTLLFYSKQSYTNQIAYTSYYNMLCLLGISIGICIKLDRIVLILLWTAFLVLVTMASTPNIQEEVYLPHIVSVYVMCFISFISELLGEIVVLSTPMVLISVWEWERWEVEYFLSLVHLIAIPVQILLTKKLYITSKQLIVNCIGLCGIGSSMITGLLYTFILQYTLGVCITIIGTYFTRAAINYYVTRAFGKTFYITVALAGVLGRAAAGFTVGLVDRENHEELNRNLFFPITLVFMLSLVIIKWKDDLSDNIKQN